MSQVIMTSSVKYNILLLTFALLSVVFSNKDEEGKYGIMFPNVNRNIPELYVCTAIRLDYTKNYYIVGFEPKATTKKVHHLVLYGCQTPGSRNTLWNCGDLSNSFVDSDLEASSPCGSKPVILYAWARDAPTLKLPPRVGFRVGGNTTIQYLVMQLHNVATDKPKDGSNDISGKLIGGLNIHYTQRPVSRLAGVFILGATGRILPMSKERWEVACTIVEDKTIHPFAIRTHAHHLGTVSSGYRVVRDSNGKHHWTLIGKLDPQKPHMFYSIANNLTITKGDILAARCSYVSARKTITYGGSLDYDEICNFYLMYYVDEGEPLNTTQCWSEGAPLYYWDSELNNIPADASTQDNLTNR